MPGNTDISVKLFRAWWCSSKYNAIIDTARPTSNTRVAQAVDIPVSPHHHHYYHQPHHYPRHHHRHHHHHYDRGPSPRTRVALTVNISGAEGPLPILGSITLHAGWWWYKNVHFLDVIQHDELLSLGLVRCCLHCLLFFLCFTTQSVGSSAQHRTTSPLMRREMTEV